MMIWALLSLPICKSQPGRFGVSPGRTFKAARGSSCSAQNRGAAGGIDLKPVLSGNAAPAYSRLRWRLSRACAGFNAVARPITLDTFSATWTNWPARGWPTQSCGPV